MPMHRRATDHDVCWRNQRLRPAHDDVVVGSGGEARVMDLADEIGARNER